jgi:membrane-bound ClpP family serine protease
LTVNILILLIAIAIGLILIEIFLIPGVGIPGIVGAVLLIVALVLAYQISGMVGHIALVVTGIISIGLVYLAFQAKTWDKLSQKEEITSKVESHTDELNIGDKGQTISRLSPMGKVMFNEAFFEVSSKGEYIEENTQVEIANIEGSKIIVIPA